MADHSIVVGLGFGDEGKGRTVQRLIKENDGAYVIRFSGGGQAAHNVVTEDGKHHTFSHFGAGTFEGAATVLSRHMMVNPLAFFNEGSHLARKLDWNPFTRTYTSVNAPMVTPLHIHTNNAAEARRGADNHGTCGLGIGETMRYSIAEPFSVPVMGDLRDLPRLRAKLELLADWYMSEGHADRDTLTDLINSTMTSYTDLMKDRVFMFMEDEQLGNLLRTGYGVFEGSQGILLDERFGFHPHTTWSDVTPAPAQLLLGEAGLPTAEVVGVTRTYHTRHGAGPFPSEYTDQAAAHAAHPELHNDSSGAQGAWRVGRLDLPLLEYAVNMIGGINKLSITHADHTINDAVTRYENVNLSEHRFNGDYARQEQFTGTLKTVETVVEPVQNAVETIEQRLNMGAAYVSSSPVG